MNLQKDQNNNFAGGSAPVGAPSGISYVPAVCTGCGAEIPVNPNQQTAECQYCGKPFIVADGIQRYNIRQNSIQTPDESERERKKKRNRTILWVFGWLLIFPVPLTILMLRSKKVRGSMKAVVLVIAWLLYAVIIYPKGGLRTKKPETRPADTPAAVRTSAEPVTEAPAQVTEPPAETTAAPETTTTAPETTAPPETTTAVETTKKAKKKKKKTETAPPETAAPETTAPTVSEPSDAEIRQSVNNGDFSLVTPEFKATMDSYEAFYDEYLAFMKKYSSGEGDLLGMLNDYTVMLERMDEWSRAIDAIDETKLTPADDAYFLLVTLRIENKLLGAM